MNCNIFDLDDYDVKLHKNIIGQWRYEFKYKGKRLMNMTPYKTKKGALKAAEKYLKENFFEMY